MRRRDLVIGLPATLLAASGRAFSQQTRKLPRIGVLVSASPPHPFADAFWRGLRPLGYSEGENIEVEFHYTGGGGGPGRGPAEGEGQGGAVANCVHLSPGGARGAWGAAPHSPVHGAPPG